MTYSRRQMEYIDSVDGAAHMSAVKIIGELEIAPNAGRGWHTVTDTLAEPGHEWVLVVVNPKGRHSRPYVTVGICESGIWRSLHAIGYGGEVSHWMQLPALPTGEQPATRCHWQLTDEYEEPWQGDCGILFVFTDAGTPQEHGMNFCPRCGRALVTAEQEEE